MTQKRALVTGGTGFVGSHLVKELLAEGWSVHVIARPNSSLEQLGSLLESVYIHRFEGNIDLMRKIVRKSRPDVVFHLASLAISVHQPEDVQRLIESNLLFGMVLVEAMCVEGVHCLVNTGSFWQHYESREYSPVNLYAATKQAFEALLQYYVEARDLRVITLKLFDTYGPNDPRNKLINLLLDAARSGNQLSLSPGEQSIDLVHVEDVVSAFTKAAGLLLPRTACGHQRFGVSSGRPLSLKALVTELEQTLGVQIPVVWGGRDYRQREAMIPWQPSDSLPGWGPRIPLRAGLRALT